MSKTMIDASTDISPFMINAIVHFLSTLTFGLGRSKSESRASHSALPVYEKAHGHARKKSSLVPHAALVNDSLRILPEVCHSLGLAGTMSGSVGGISEQDCDGGDPDSNVPDASQVILSNLDQEVEDAMSFDRELVRPPLAWQPVSEELASWGSHLLGDHDHRRRPPR